MMWDGDGSRAVGAKVLSIHVDRFDAGRDAEGNPLPAGVDLVETGRLRSSFELEVDETGAAVVNTAEHAAPVNARVAPFMGASGDELDRIEDVFLAELDRIEAAR